MDLELGRRADYGIRAAIDLARNHDAGSRRKAREIAEAMGIPATYVGQVLAELVRAGLAASTAGRYGGYRLAHHPGEVSLLAVIRAVDDEPGSAVCVLRGGPCGWEDVCAVHEPWLRAQQAMIDELDEVTLGEIIEIDDALAEGDPPPDPLDAPSPRPPPPAPARRAE